MPVSHKFLAGRKLMHSIKINYIADENIDKNRLEKILDYSPMKNYKLKIDMHDFSLGKGSIKNFVDESENKNIRVFEHPFEDRRDIQKTVLKNITDEFAVFANIKTNIILNTDIIDCIDFKELNKNYAYVYTDYLIGKVRCYMQSHRSGATVNTPLIFWNTKKVIGQKEEDDVFNTVYGNNIGLQIPKAACKIIYD